MLINEKQKHLIESDAKTNGIARVSVWLYNSEKNAITSEAIFSLSQNTFLPGLTLYKKDFPIYFKALEAERIIDANDALTDPRTSEFSEVYLKPLNITSMLDVPVKIGNHTIGVVCHEHVGEKRVWTKEEILYATSIADLFALAMETAEKDNIINALLDSEKRFNFALSTLPVIFWSLDKNLKFTSSKGNGLKKIGLEADQAVGYTIYEFFQTNDEKHIAISSHLKALKGESVKYDFEYLGNVFETIVEPIKNDSNEIIGCTGLAINITERKKAEEIIKNREHQLSSIYDAVADVIFVIAIEEDEQYRFESVNNAFLTTTGLPAEAVVGKMVHEIVPEPSLSLVKDRYKKAIKTKSVITWEETTDYPTGKLTGIVSVAPVYDKNGVCYQLIGSVKDITDRKKIENELKASEERYRLLTETTNVIPWESDADTFQFTYVGPQALAILGYPINDWYTNDFWPIHIHPDDREETLAYCVNSFKSKENYEFDYRMIAKNGDIIWFHDVVTVEIKNDKPVALRGYLIDITARKIVEEKNQKLNAELELRVEERTAELIAINKELIKAKIAAEESKVAKELFLASMSHEIRTPLNAIIGFQQLLKETPLNEEQHEFVESIDFAGRNLLVIINDILDLSKIESGKFEFDEIEFNVSDVVHSVIELVEHRAKEKHLQLFFSHDSTIPKELFGDSTRLSQVLLNLLGNAVKFTEKGEVKILTRLLTETKDYVECEFIVSDTGIGISEDKLPMIFDSFSQENIETTRKYGGTGLGLTISKRLVEMQGGTISVSSEKGKGSAFTVRMKIKKLSSHAEADKNKKEAGFNINLKNKKLAILLAEDVVLNQRLVVKIMERWGHDLDIADNGKIAVDMVQAKDYDLVLMDIQMPIMDGYHAAEMIRSLSDLKKQKVPIIALTAHASHAEAEKCLNLGMNAYLAKPFNQQSLQTIINQLTADK